MEIYKYPKEYEWSGLCERPKLETKDLNQLVVQIFEEIQKDGDVAIRKFSKMYDKSERNTIKIAQDEINGAEKLLSMELKNAIKLAKDNIQKFHNSQIEKTEVIETTAGVKCWRESRAIEKVGIYIPGGTAPLFSTVLMLGIPAALAGCEDVILCSPPNTEGNIHPAILYCAQLVGIKQIFAAGGIQAIGGMTFGTDSIPKVDKLFGPGNQYVTAAKQVAQNYGVAIDMPAGPSEVLIIADQQCNPDFVAADLLSQAEHGIDSQVILLSNDDKVINDTLKSVESQLETLPRKELAKQALENSKAILLNNMEDSLIFSNRYAPEHLILATENARDLALSVKNAGSVFLGNYSCESAGDYASGTNHTLPTNGYARNYSGVSLDSFVKKITFQELTPMGIQNIGPAIEVMAEAEELFAHKNAVTLRLKSL